MPWQSAIVAPPARTGPVGDGEDGVWDGGSGAPDSSTVAALRSTGAQAASAVIE